MKGECPNLKENLTHCTCTYNCGRRGRCCECLQHHLEHQQLPACCFPPEIGQSGERSIAKFVEYYSRKVSSEEEK